MLNDYIDDILLEKANVILKDFNEFQLIMMNNFKGSITKIGVRIYYIKSELIRIEKELFEKENYINTVLLN